MTPLITVIVPCYNVEKYLPKCIDSIINQTYQNLEIILVDDGSPDNCGEICDDYALKDARIKVIHKPNGGLSDARNVAIDIAKGEYITFIDSDDYISNKYIEVLVDTIITTNSDISIANYYFEKEETHKLKIAYPQIKERISYSSQEALLALLYQRTMETAAWGKLYKAYLWKEIRFPKGKLWEDIATIYKTFFISNKISLAPEPLYYYLLRRDSIMGTTFNPKKMDAISSSKMMFDEIIKQGDNNLICAAKCRYVSMCFNILFQTPKDSKEESQIYNEILRHRYSIIKDKSARIKTKLALIISFFGLRILRTTYKLKN